MNVDKRKLTLFVVALVFYAGLCISYAVIASRAAEDSAVQIIRTWSNTISNQLQKVMDYRSKDFLYLLSFELSQPVTTEEQAFAVIKRIEDRNDTAFAQMRIIDAKGTAYNSEGKVSGQLDNPLVLSNVRDKGYAIGQLHDMIIKQDSVLLIVPAQGSSRFFFARMFSPAVFAHNVLSEISAFSESTHLGVFYKNAMLAVSDQQPCDKGRQIISRLAAAGHDFLDTKKKFEIQNTGLLPDHNVFIRLCEGNDWYLASFIPVNSVLPFYSSMLWTSAVVFTFLLVLIVLIIVLDVLNRKEKQRELYLMSSADSLTGLMNGLGLQSVLSDFLKKGIEKNSLVCMDMVSFRRFNNMFGFTAGDTLLRTVASAIKKDFICGTRISGDMFCFLAPSVTDIVPLIENKLHEGIKSELGEQYLQLISFTFGIFHILDQQHSASEVYDGALLALKTAKKAPRQHVVTYGKQLQERVDLQKNMELNMLHALSKNEFALYVQPKYNIQKGECSGGEALVRWNSEKLGFLMPDQFIPLFEKNSFIIEVDFFMLATSFQHIQSRLEKGQKVLPLAVNQSKTTITFPNYIERLKNIIKRYPIPLEYIEIEITESALENDYGKIVKLFNEIKELGFTMTMDDFGSGFSSLNTLRELPVDVLKIDRAFLEESDSSKRARMIIKNIINMSKELGVHVVCEGVETKTQLDFLKQNGCDYMQGYYYAKPMSYEEYEQRYLDETEK